MTAVFTGGEEPDNGSSSLRGERGTIARRERRWGLFFVSPWIIGLLTFFLIPIVASFVLSFTNYTLASTEPTEFVGLDNWRRIFDDPRVSHGLWVTLKFACFAVPLGIFVPLALAYL